MTQEEARKLLHVILMSAMKAKSNIIEALGDDDISTQILEMTEPMLFSEPGKPNLIEALTRMEKKPFLEKGDVVNALYLLDKSPATYMCTVLWQRDIPDQMDVLRGDFETPAFE